MANHKPLLSTEVRDPRFFYGYIILLVSFVILMIVWGTQFSFGVFFKPVLNQFDWTRTATSGAYSLSMVLNGFFGIFAGRLSDRFGPRLVVTVCGFLVGLGYLLISQISAIWQMYLLYGVLISVGLAGMWVPLLSTVARWFTKRRGLASGIAASGIGVGTVIMPPLANQLITSYSWRTSYIIISLIVLVITVTIAQSLRRDPSQKGLLAYGTDPAKIGGLNLEDRGYSVQEAIHSWQFWIICIIGFCASFCVQNVVVHIVPHATDIGVSAAAAAIILSIVGIVNIGGKLGMGNFIDRIGSIRVLVIIFILLTVSFLWILLANELWMLYLFAVVFGAGYGGFAAVQSPLVAEYFGLKAHGAIFGLVIFAVQTGGAAGSLVAGYIYDIRSSYYWAFILCAILGIASLILSILLKPTRKPR
ncbi:MAG: MFS transporter [Dehalococcoidales bacterium]|nr:MFS transporter [Dehalococcoidales bacterium]